MYNFNITKSIISINDNGRWINDICMYCIEY
jgi:hypothetical protein